MIVKNIQKMQVNICIIHKNLQNRQINTCLQIIHHNMNLKIENLYNQIIVLFNLVIIIFLKLPSLFFKTPPASGHLLGHCSSFLLKTRIGPPSFHSRLLSPAPAHQVHSKTPCCTAGSVASQRSVGGLLQEESCKGTGRGVAKGVL